MSKFPKLPPTSISHILHPMKQSFKKILVKLHLIAVYRAAKYLVAVIKPRNIISNLAYKFRPSPDGFPIPPLYLIYLTINNPSIADYFRGSHITADSIKKLLTKNHINPDKIKEILELGSGCGRVLRAFRPLKNAKLYGSDYNPKLVKWCQRKLKFAKFSKNKLNPPLKYTDKKFDFIYLISVFTHLPHATQLNWLKEFHRIIKPHKHLLITLHGEHIVNQLTPEEKAQFKEKGYIERNADKPGSNHYGTFHSKAHFEKMIKGLFRIKDVSYGGKPDHPYQDLYLLEKCD